MPVELSLEHQIAAIDAILSMRFLSRPLPRECVLQLREARQTLRKLIEIKTQAEGEDPDPEKMGSDLMLILRIDNACCIQSPNGVDKNLPPT